MNQKSQKFVMKGFTLLEMMIVLGIIGVLTAVVIPISKGYYESSRLRTQNANAKVIYNSLQTVCQEFEFNERSINGSVFYGNGANATPTNSDTSKEGTIALLVERGSLIKVVVNHTLECKTTGAFDESLKRIVTRSNGDIEKNHSVLEALDTAPVKVGTTEPDVSNFIQRVNKIYSNAESTCYFAYIDGYSVKAAYCADSIGSFYIGAFPTRLDEKSEFTLDDIRFDDSSEGLSDDAHINDKRNVLTYVNLAWN